MALADVNPDQLKVWIKKMAARPDFCCLLVLFCLVSNTAPENWHVRFISSYLHTYFMAGLSVLALQQREELFRGVVWNASVPSKVSTRRSFSTRVNGWFTHSRCFKNKSLNTLNCNKFRRKTSSIGPRFWNITVVAIGTARMGYRWAEDAWNVFLGITKCNLHFVS